MHVLTASKQCSLCTPLQHGRPCAELCLDRVCWCVQARDASPAEAPPEAHTPPRPMPFMASSGSSLTSGVRKHRREQALQEESGARLKVARLNMDAVKRLVQRIGEPGDSGACSTKPPKWAASCLWHSAHWA